MSLLALTAPALASLRLHQLVDHLYFRPRPYWALPAVHVIGARRGDSSFFSMEAAIAAALACGLLLAARRWRPTRARVYGQVTYVNSEFDGDVHIVLKAPDGAFVVPEIIPELPIRAPHDDDRITAWGYRPPRRAAQLVGAPPADRLGQRPHHRPSHRRPGRLTMG